VEQVGSLMGSKTASPVGFQFSTASVNPALTVTFDWKLLQYLPTLIQITRLQKYFVVVCYGVCFSVRDQERY
jgi:hypothetical protein